MRYVGTVYCPPSEANAYILQATTGCSWNKCTDYSFPSSNARSTFRAFPSTSWLTEENLEMLDVEKNRR